MNRRLDISHLFDFEVGYSIEGPAQAILDAGAQGFIQKPVNIKALSEKLKDLRQTR